jgi:hypothetical protein
MPASLAHPTRAAENVGRKGWPVPAMIEFGEAWSNWRGDYLAQWYRARTENARGARKPMIVALARKLLIALWRFVRQGVVPDGVILRPAQ